VLAALKRLKRNVRPITLGSLPASWDSVAMGYVGPVKNQGGCGSCWNFSGTGICEIAGNVAGIGGGPNSFILAEQYTMDCYGSGGCNGDDNTTVLQHADSDGLPLLSVYGPYLGKSSGSCKVLPPGSLYQIKTWGFCDGGHGQGITATQLIQSAIAQNGGVGCAVAAGPDWDSYTGGETAGSGNTDVNHDVILVGWRPSTLKPGKLAWKVRNSWSDTWGEEGYMWLTEGGDQIGTEAVFAMMGTMPIPPIVPPVGPTPPPVNPSRLFGLTFGRMIPKGKGVVFQAPVNIQPGHYDVSLSPQEGEAEAQIHP
jgi:C1A family cysteine protease